MLTVAVLVLVVAVTAVATLRDDVVFEVARQVVTLVLNDDHGSVTALRIPD